MIRSQLHLIGQPVRSLQTMLRTISFAYPFLPRLTPDGIFGERTLEAVMLFQREFFPPVTGQVNQATWDAIVSLYHQVVSRLTPLPTRSFPSPEFSVAPGEASVHLNLVQSMFCGLSRVLNGVETCDGDCKKCQKDHKLHGTRRYLPETRRILNIRFHRI